MTSHSDEFARTTRDAAGRLVLRRREDVVAAAHDPIRFSSAVSRHLQVPNGMDGEEHAAFRRLLDPFFAPERMKALAPDLEQLARTLVASMTGRSFDAVTDLGARYAVRAQTLWLGWPDALEDELLAWVASNRAATRSGDRARTAEVARHFDAIIRTILADHAGEDATTDLTTELVRLRTEDGRRLTAEEIVSILRNWTGGDLSTIALCAGVITHWLAEHPDHQPALRDADDATVDAALDELLRIDDPFVSNRRIVTTDTAVGGCPVAAGEQVVLDWRAANRDPDAFGDVDAFAPERNASRNLVYGTGPHVCPGRPLATLELRVLVRAVLEAGTITLDPARPAVREEAPVAGFRFVPVILHPSHQPPRSH